MIKQLYAWISRDKKTKVETVCLMRLEQGDFHAVSGNLKSALKQEPFVLPPSGKDVALVKFKRKAK